MTFITSLPESRQHRETRAISVILTDDDTLFLDALKIPLQFLGGINVIGTTSNGEQLLVMLEKKKPDIVLLKINLPDKNGLELTKMIDDRMPCVRVIARSDFDHPNYVKATLRNGARGFVSKSTKIEELLQAIREVHEGKIYISPTLEEFMIHEMCNSRNGDQVNRINQLTYREIELIKELTEGCTTREIARKFFISEKTVERHKNNIFHKLKVKNTAQLVKVAFKNGLLLN